MLLIMYHFATEGPKILYSVNSKDLSPVTVSSLGVILSIAIGQGQNLFRGLYGPLPIQDTDSLVICYTTLLKDDKQPDKRLQGQNFVIFAFIYPKEVERLILYDKRKLSSNFSKFCLEYPDIEMWNNSVLSLLRKETLESFIN